MLTLRLLLYCLMHASAAFAAVCCYAASERRTEDKAAPDMARYATRHARSAMPLLYDDTAHDADDAR